MSLPGSQPKLKTAAVSGALMCCARVFVAGGQQRHLRLRAVGGQTFGGGLQGLGLHIESPHAPAGAYALGQQQGVVAVAGGAVQRVVAGAQALTQQLMGECKDAGQVFHGRNFPGCARAAEKEPLC